MDVADRNMRPIFPRRFEVMQTMAVQLFLLFFKTFPLCKHDLCAPHSAEVYISARNRHSPRGLRTLEGVWAALRVVVERRTQEIHACSSREVAIFFYEF